MTAGESGELGENYILSLALLSLYPKCGNGPLDYMFMFPKYQEYLLFFYKWGSLKIIFEIPYPMVHFILISEDVKSVSDVSSLRGVAEADNGL